MIFTGTQLDEMGKQNTLRLLCKEYKRNSLLRIKKNLNIILIEEIKEKLFIAEV